MFCFQSNTQQFGLTQLYNQPFPFQITQQNIQSLITQSYKKHRPKNYDNLYEKFYQTILCTIKNQIQVQLIDQVFVTITSYANNTVKKQFLNHIEEINSILSDSSVSQPEQDSNIHYASQHNQSHNLHFLDSEVKDLEKSQSFQYFQKVFQDQTYRQSQKTLRKILNCNLFINETIYPEYHPLKQIGVQTDFQNTSKNDLYCSSKSIIISQTNIDQIVKKQNKNEVLYMKQFNQKQLKRKQLKKERKNQGPNLQYGQKFQITDDSIESRTLQKIKPNLDITKPIDYKVQYQKKKKNILFRKSIDFIFKRKF